MDRSRLKVIGALGIIEILAWGSVYYLLGVLASPISRDTGWPVGFVVGGFSIGLVMSALVSPFVGRMIQRHGGRPVLASGALLLCAGLVLVGLAPNLPAFLAAWALLGVGMSATLYDASFSTLGRLYGLDARRAIGFLTLFGGMASPVCWPIAALLTQHFGWRAACFVFAATHLAVTLPLALSLPREEKRDLPGKSGSGGPQAILDPGQRRVFVLLSAILVLGASLAAMISINLITLLQTRGISLAAAVAVSAMFGPAQVVARIVEMSLGSRLHPIWTLAIAGMGGAAGLLMLLSGQPSIAAAIVLFGAGNGVWSIARAALPLALFGPRVYPVIMGKLALPSLLGQAAAPLAAAGVIGLGHAEWVFAALACVALFNLALIAWLILTRRRAGPGG